MKVSQNPQNPNARRLRREANCSPQSAHGTQHSLRVVRACPQHHGAVSSWGRKGAVESTLKNVWQIEGAGGSTTASMLSGRTLAWLGTSPRWQSSRSAAAAGSLAPPLARHCPLAVQHHRHARHGGRGAAGQAGRAGAASKPDAHALAGTDRLPLGGATNNAGLVADGQGLPAREPLGADRD